MTIQGIKYPRNLPYQFYEVEPIDIRLWRLIRQQIPDSIEDAKAEYLAIMQQREFDNRGSK